MYIYHVLINALSYLSVLILRLVVVHRKCFSICDDMPRLVRMLLCMLNNDILTLSFVNRKSQLIFLGTLSVPRHTGQSRRVFCFLYGQQSQDRSALQLLCLASVYASHLQTKAISALKSAQVLTQKNSTGLSPCHYSEF